MMQYQVRPPGILAKLDKDELQPLYNLASNTEVIDGFESMNRNLAGNIAKQVELTQPYKDILEGVLDPVIKAHFDNFDYLKKVSVLDIDCPMYITQAWMVLQEKYEFNPIHNHTGVFSFVLWLKIPYNREDEFNHPFSINSNTPCAGQFSYILSDCNNDIVAEFIETDKELEGCAFVFPSKMNHCVYPFYTSDDYRISIAGNYRVRVPDEVEEDRLLLGNS
tara:strand:+ start:63 stop:725 length:663 start_codon:yes stop_codon:yes gene_type:complete